MKTPSPWGIALLAVAGLLAAVALGAAAFMVAGEDSPGLSAGSVAAGEPLVPITSATTTAAEPRRRVQPAGRALFIRECGGCHALASAGTNGTAGPDLDELTPGFDDVVDQVTGGGDGMPAFGGVLTTGQIETLAAYVSGAASEPGGPRSGTTTNRSPVAPRATTQGTRTTAPSRTTTQRTRTAAPPRTTRTTPTTPARTVTDDDEYDDSGKDRDRDDERDDDSGGGRDDERDDDSGGGRDD